MSLIERTLAGSPLPPDGHALLVDVGCGTGVNLDALARFGKVIGVDISETALNFCRRRKHYLLCRAAMNCLPFESGSVQLLTAFDVLEHGADDDAMLAEAFRVCAPGGRVFLSVPAYSFMWGDHDVAAHHYRRYSSHEVRTKVEAGGFEIQRLTFLNSFLFPISVVFRQGKTLLLGACRRLGKRSAVSTDFRLTQPPLINPVLLRIFSSEGLLLRHFNLPFGLSICCVARKPCATRYGGAHSQKAQELGHAT